MKCALCKGSGENKSGIAMLVNNNICPRCGGYGAIPDGIDGNEKFVTEKDRKFAASNGVVDAK